MPQGTSGVSIGYRRIGAWVADFDGALQKPAALGTPPLLAPLGEPGKRRTCVRNPDGVFVEMMEKDPLPRAPGHEREGSVAHAADA